MTREEFYFDSRDGVNKIRAIRWIPDGEIKAILQIVHGMAEHIERYDDFASFMAQNGYLVAANDHLGHGMSCSTEEKQGHFCELDPLTVVVRDIHRLKKKTQEKYPGKKYIILGHSMGSLLLRNYLFRYGKGIDGAIIMGTANHPRLVSESGKLLLKTMALFKGWEYKSKFAASLVMGNPNKRITNRNCDFDWLSRDEKQVKKYVDDNKCGFMFTLNGYYTVVSATANLSKKSELSKMPKDLPVLFVSGSEDPIGNYGAAVTKSYEEFKKAGMNNVKIKLYPGARHEILNEINNQEVYEDLLDFVKGI